MILSDKVKILRQERGWTQRELGKMLGNEYGGHVSLIEAGKRPNMSLEIACKLANIFEITIDELINETEFDKRQNFK